MILTVQDIITEMMRVIGALDPDETPTTTELSSGLTAINMMMGKWSAENLMIRSTSPDVLPLKPGQYIYTIGARNGSDFNTSVPIKIINAYIRDDENVDTPLKIVGQIEYFGIDDKAIATARPELLYYDPGFTQTTNRQGTITFYPIPDGSQTYHLVMESDKYLTEFASVSDTFSFEPVYYEACVYNLAVREYRKYHVSAPSVPEDIVRLAAESKKIVERMNAPTVISGMDIPGKISVYNIYTDTYR